MEVYTPFFNKLRGLLEREILQYIGENFVVSSNDINNFVMKLKEANQDKEKSYELIDFTFSYPYSSQIQNLLVDLVRRCVIKQTREGYELTSYGYRLIGIDI
jgi:hypothetical protein